MEQVYEIRVSVEMVENETLRIYKNEHDVYINSIFKDSDKEHLIGFVSNAQKFNRILYTR